MSDFIKALEISQKEKPKHCEFKTSKYCIIVDFDMIKADNKYCCPACFVDHVFKITPLELQDKDKN